MKRVLLAALLLVGCSAPQPPSIPTETLSPQSLGVGRSPAGEAPATPGEPASGQSPEGGATPIGSADQALARAAAFLQSKQSPDGSWKSANYRDMGSGLELTPFAAKALMFSGESLANGQRGLKFLLEAKNPELFYPVYTASGVLLLLSRDAHPDQAQGWVDLLSSLQLSDKLGWSPTDPDYGGWGYAMKPPAKAKHDPLGHSNVSSTVFALGGLRVAGIPAKDPRVQHALAFVRRCQAKDGGFFASPTDMAMNKTGALESYGSASSDGLRCLLRADLPPTDPAVQKARAWLDQHFDDQHQPGKFPEARYLDRDSLLFYYFWSTAHALNALQRAGAKPNDAEKALSQKMAARLLQLQRPDGSWANPAGASREDDPLVATPMAMAALYLSSHLAK